MQKKAVIVLGILLAAILCVQLVLLSTVNKLYRDIRPGVSFTSEVIDGIGTKLNMLQLTVDEILEELQGEK